ncbi:MAG: hypothetical protein JNJ83_07950 [Verrucomicrobiaceae bacterium]|nr:hypothetical protein [Verrucomicrobiaceae bacterium]
MTQWDETSLHDALEKTAAAQGVKAGALMPLLRFALTGQNRGPGVTTILDLVGKDGSLRRIERTLKTV